MRELPSGIVTFLFSDVEGSTRLLVALGERYLPLHADHQRLVREALGRHAGVEVSTEGDSFFAAFRDAEDAALAAAAIGRAMATHPWPADARIRVRIGLHTGQGVVAADDYVGIDVNRAARISAAANGGQVILSQATRELVADRLAPGLSLVDLGGHRLKDVGIEHLWRLDLDTVASDPRAPRTLEAGPSNLPAEARPLIDREAERATLRDLLASGRLVTVTGPGGIGKSALALQVARELRGRFLDGIGYVDVASIDDVESAAAALVEGIELRGDPGQLPSEALVEQLRNREVLLVIETAEHLAGIASLVARLFGSCSRLRLLVTGRAPLHLGDEHELRLEPLAPGPAEELFLARARAIGPGVLLSDPERDAVSAICRRLDGVPLAIELAAARTRVLAPTAILERLERRLTLLTGGALDAPARQRTLEATIDWSYASLTPAEQVQLQALSVFAGTFGLEAAESVTAAAGLGITGPDVLELLEGLIDKSLLERVDAGGRLRFRLLGTIREYALLALGEAGGEGPARMAHAEHWLAVASATAAAFDAPGSAARVAELGRDEDELRAALEWCLGPGARADLALRLAAALGPFWYARGRAREGGTWLQRALAAAPVIPDRVRADALFWAGVLADERRRPAEAMTLLEASLALRRDLGDTDRIARTINSLGVVARNVGELERGRALLLEALELKRSAADPRLGSTLTNLGILAVDEDRLDDARALFEQALAADARSGTAEPHPAVLLGLGHVQVLLGEVDAGEARLLYALRAFAVLDDALAMAECLEALGEAWEPRRPGNALALLSAAAKIRAVEGVAPDPRDVHRLEALDRRLEARLEVAAAAQARAEGRAMDAPAAARYVEAIATSG